MRVQFLLVLTFMIYFKSCHSCANPSVSVKSYTTEDATILTNVAYIIQFNIKCPNNSPYTGNLYALTKQNIVPVASTRDNEFQVSWTEDTKNAQVGDITIKIFNEEGHVALRKASRSGEDLNSIPHYLVLELNHPGSYKGPCISCEFLAAIFSFVIAYYAIHLNRYQNRRIASFFFDCVSQASSPSVF